jgi:hypothetical protein
MQRNGMLDQDKVAVLITKRNEHGTYVRDVIEIVDKLEAVRLKMVYGKDFYDMTWLLETC